MFSLRMGAISGCSSRGSSRESKAVRTKLHRPLEVKPVSASSVKNSDQYQRERAPMLRYLQPRLVKTSRGYKINEVMMSSLF